MISKSKLIGLVRITKSKLIGQVKITKSTLENTWTIKCLQTAEPRKP